MMKGGQTMTSNNPYNPGRHYYRQDQDQSGQNGGYHGHGSVGSLESSLATYSQGSMPRVGKENRFPYHDPNFHGNGNTYDNSMNSFYPNNSYHDPNFHGNESTYGDSMNSFYLNNSHHDPNFHGNESTYGDTINSFYPNNLYHDPSFDRQYMIRMMISLENQLDKLTQLIAQNNQLLMSIHDQEDTKCVKGGGGGAIIVRM
ncbi:hypothetical protein [Rossellomorea sp. BNER]|uniref:hypothetical protein n=1 Tax=Rossellomorea sp. BNER TaxID=2962031 RepID=UPI003AF28BFC